MAKRVIILDQLDTRTYRYALWADVPPPRQPFYAKPGAVSVWTGASAAENAALASGAIVEHVDQFNVPAGTPIADVRALLQTQWQGFQDRITADNPWVRYGTFWDGVTWTPGGVS